MDFLVTGATSPSTREYQSYGGATKSLRETAITAGSVVVATYELPNQDRDAVSAGVSHSGSRGQKYEFLTSSNTAAFVSASLRLGDITVRPNLRYGNRKQNIVRQHGCDRKPDSGIYASLQGQSSATANTASLIAFIEGLYDGQSE